MEFTHPIPVQPSYPDRHDSLLGKKISVSMVSSFPIANHKQIWQEGQISLHKMGVEVFHGMQILQGGVVHNNLKKCWPHR